MRQPSAAPTAMTTTLQWLSSSLSTCAARASPRSPPPPIMFPLPHILLSSRRRRPSRDAAVGGGRFTAAREVEIPATSALVSPRRLHLQARLCLQEMRSRASRSSSSLVCFAECEAAAGHGRIGHYSCLAPGKCDLLVFFSKERCGWSWLLGIEMILYIKMHKGAISLFLACWIWSIEGLLPSISLTYTY